ncbi:hypothetical protein EWF20_06040 [Sulfolobus sp. S-194]|uniref:hypothetical protein n=1 Tax=Sulfolobus sp. S-194 TaxID=2512240 RepID=UPI001436E50E|nr:hypothetical protein [Sulfolobus sp. S-194]QIW23760.1 hypothetical protein EWF20_06040 [Sulfolobus sp. S-194]
MELSFHGNSFQFWRRNNNIQLTDILDPFALTSELHLYGDFTDPNPLFRILLKSIYKSREKLSIECDIKRNKDKLKVNYWKIKCPYCGEEFPYSKKKPLRCPKCNNVIEKVDFRTWNSNLEKFLYGEISIKELFDSPITPTSENYEKLRDVFLDPDIPKAKINFKNGFDAIYKLFSPNQLLVISDIIKQIREKREEEIPIYSLALVDFVTYNSMFSISSRDKIFSIFSSKELKTEEWVELTQSYFCISLKKVLKGIKEKRNGSPKIIASHPFTLDIEVLYNIELFFYEWVKRPLSYSNGYTLIPRLFKDYIYSCIDKECESFYEKDFEFSSNIGNLDKAIFYLDELDFNSLVYIVSLKDFYISKIEIERNLFKIELIKGRKGVRPFWEIYTKIKKENNGIYLNVLSLTLREFTKYERILGISNDPAIILKYALKISSEITNGGKATKTVS